MDIGLLFYEYLRSCYVKYFIWIPKFIHRLFFRSGVVDKTGVRSHRRDGKWGSQCVCSPLGSSQWESTTCGIVSLSAIGPRPGPRPRLHNAWFAGNGPKNLASTRPFPQERLEESSVGGIFMTIAGRRSGVTETLQVICQIFLWEFLFIWENISVFLWIFWIWMSRRDTFRCRWQVTVIVHSTFWESASHGKSSAT